MFEHALIDGNKDSIRKVHTPIGNRLVTNNFNEDDRLNSYDTRNTKPSVFKVIQHMILVC